MATHMKVPEHPKLVAQWVEAERSALDEWLGCEAIPLATEIIEMVRRWRRQLVVTTLRENERHRIETAIAGVSAFHDAMAKLFWGIYGDPICNFLPDPEIDDEFDDDLDPSDWNPRSWDKPEITPDPEDFEAI